MPNHCTNIMTLEGPKDSISEFRKTHFEKDSYGNNNFSFNHVVPCHEDLYNARAPGYTQEDIDSAKDEETRAKIQAAVDESTANEEKYGHTDWYNFCLSEWGTKWGA